jgi:pilus assembly protein CpaC
VDVDGVGDGILLTGSVATAAEAQAAFDIAWRLAGDKEKVSNSITVQNRDQVMLKVTAAEMQRDIVKQLGIDLAGVPISDSAVLTSGSKIFALKNANPFSANGQPLVAGNQVTVSNGSISASLRAMERAGVIRTLAEPTLTAISGETASFLAGGEFPINSGTTCDPGGVNCHTTIVFKKFGVSLTFLPVVLSEGRISLRVMTEVSELSSEVLLTSADGTTIPSIKTRRAETTVEIPSGGTLAMAGMMQQQTKQQLNGFPGLMQVPILGALFKSRDYVNRQTELAFFITPYVVRATAQKELSRPDDGFADASDPASVLIGNVNRIYGVPAAAESKRRYYGNIGFILD